MTWFEDLTGCSEESPESVRQQLSLDGHRLSSLRNGNAWICGELEISTLAQWRAQVAGMRAEHSPNSVSEVVANVRDLHREDANSHAMFQVASQFNLLEMASPNLTPESGVGIYEYDLTQGPACAISAGAGTIYRNYFVNVDGQIGQSAERQVDCLADIGDLLGNSGNRLWKMVNGYAWPTASGLSEINQTLYALDEPGRDRIRQALRIGVQWQTQVTLDGATHLVSQAYCSAMPVRYTRHSPALWEPFATLVLEAAYESTVCAAIVNKVRTGCKRLYLTLLGGGVFGNNLDWIISAMRRSLELYADSGLQIAIVSHSASNRAVRELVREVS